MTIRGMMAKKIRFAGRCSCGAEFAVDEENDFVAIVAARTWREWQELHRGCIPARPAKPARLTDLGGNLPAWLLEKGE